MRIIMRKLTIFLLIIALTHSLTEGACTERTDTVTSTDQLKPNESESVSTSVSNFFTDVGCSIKSGAKAVKERVQSGYQFIRRKIENDDSATNPTEHNNNGRQDNFNSKEESKFIDNHPQVPLAPFDDQIVFDGPIQTTTPVGFSLDDRVALTAPTICRKGERLVNDRCRKVSDF